MLQAATIVVSCGLANFEPSPWSTYRRHEVWRTHGEQRTKEDSGKFVHSFKDNYPGMCKDRSIWTIDCRKFDDPDLRQEHEETHWPKSEDHEVHSDFGSGSPGKTGCRRRVAFEETAKRMLRQLEESADLDSGRH